MQRKPTTTASDSSGFTLIELLIVVTILGVLAAMAIPGLLGARQAGAEASAIGSMRTINSAQFVYATTCGSGYFAPTLPALGMALPGATPFLSPDLTGAASVVKSQYTITMGSTGGPVASAPGTCNGLGPGAATSAYWATATPTVGAGTRAFGTNTGGVVWQATQLVPLAMTDTTAPAGAVPIK